MAWSIYKGRGEAKRMGQGVVCLKNEQKPRLGQGHQKGAKLEMDSERGGDLGRGLTSLGPSPNLGLK